MKTTFYSDNGARCYRCSGTIHAYHCDDAVSLIDIDCVSCKAADLISVTPMPTTPAQASAAHREAVR